MPEIKIPKGEISWVSYYDTDGKLCFVLTSKPMRDFYFLYEISGGNLKKLGKAKSPLELEEKYGVMEHLSK